jgi:signal transduction histidine kinase
MDEASTLRDWIMNELSWQADILTRPDEAVIWWRTNPFCTIIVNGACDDDRLENWFDQIRHQTSRGVVVVLGITEKSIWSHIAQTNSVFSFVPVMHSQMFLKTVLISAHEHEQMLSTLMDNEKYVMLGQLLTGAAHELNNSLTGILGFTNMMLGEQESSTLKNDIFTIYHEAKRCQQIVQGLLTMGRDPYVEKMNVQIDQIVDSVLDVQQFNLNKHSITVYKDYAPEISPVHVNYYQIQQVLINIVINAIQSIRDGNKPGEIRIEIFENAINVTIVIHDNGPGFNSEDAELIFKPFYTTKAPGEGTGLGLSICKEILHAHDGHIHAHSGEGDGAEFVIEIPKTTSVEPEQIPFNTNERRVN